MPEMEEVRNRFMEVREILSLMNIMIPISDDCQLSQWIIGMQVVDARESIPSPPPTHRMPAPAAPAAAAASPTAA